MEQFGLETVVVITVIAYLLGEAVKLIPALENDKIPVVCGLAGGVLGVAAMFVMPDFPADDVLTAAAVGIVSGLAATGWDQVCRHMNTTREDSR